MRKNSLYKEGNQSQPSVLIKGFIPEKLKRYMKNECQSLDYETVNKNLLARIMANQNRALTTESFAEFFMIENITEYEMLINGLTSDLYVLPMATVAGK